MVHERFLSPDRFGSFHEAGCDQLREEWYRAVARILQDLARSRGSPRVRCSVSRDALTQASLSARWGNRIEIFRRPVEGICTAVFRRLICWNAARRARSKNEMRGSLVLLLPPSHALDDPRPACPERGVSFMRDGFPARCFFCCSEVS